MHPGRALLVVLLALTLLVPAAGASDRHPTQGELEGEVMCPTCHTTLDQSDSAIAVRMKAFIARRIAAGDTRTQIEDELAATFGRSVIERPGTHGFDLLAWLLPLVGILGAAAVVALAAWRWTKGSRGPRAVEPPLDAEVERRVDEELARYDG
jgi:cytochrome c-type biogenesis protein CcmH/NrfF